MLLLNQLRCFGLWMVLWCCLVLVQGSRRCDTQYVGRANVTTELQSDVLLPCIFEPTLLGSDRTADVAAVWSQTNITVDNLVEIKLQGVVMFWSSRGGRIKAFPKLSESGNFSILLRNVQRSDLGLYRCELYEGIDCSIAYQELHLSFAAVSEHQKAVIAGTSGGLVLLLFTVCVCYVGSKRKRNTKEEAIYENDKEFREMKDTSRGCSKRSTKEEAIYENDLEFTEMKNPSSQYPAQGNSIYVNCERNRK